MARRSRILIWLLALAFAVAACAASGSGPGPGTSAPATSAPSSVPATAAATTAGQAHLRKVIVIMEENHDLGEVFPSGMPYLWSLAQRYGQATNWSDIGHPSLPNYLAIFGGSSFDNPQDCDPGPGCTYPSPTVFGQALAHGATARAYEEAMPRPCDASSAGNYDVNHNPWAYFPGEASQCRANDLPAGTTSSGALISDIRAGKLPTVGMITPNLQHDAHNGSLAQADGYLRQWLPALMSGPDWHRGRLAIVVVFDEGDATDHVPFVILAPQLARTVMKQPTNQYALTRLIDTIIGAPPLRHAAGTPSLTRGFGLTAG
jgi:phosphatidylinositol-3-phosphatase